MTNEQFKDIMRSEASFSRAYSRLVNRYREEIMFESERWRVKSLELVDFSDDLDCYDCAEDWNDEYELVACDGAYYCFTIRPKNPKNYLDLD